jgi:hypothetical protein
MPGPGRKKQVKQSDARRQISQAGCQIVAPVPKQDIKNEGASGDMYENK